MVIACLQHSLHHKSLGKEKWESNQVGRGFSARVLVCGRETKRKKYKVKPHREREHVRHIHAREEVFLYVHEITR